jgi:MFS family permease
VLFLVGTSNYLDRNLISVLLEQMKSEYHVSDTMLGLVSGISFALFYATLGIPVARWADRGDRKQVISWSLAIWSVMTACCGLVGPFWQLVVARFGVGAGEAGAIPPAQSLIADYFSPTERARAIGIFLMSSSAGYALGLIGGGIIAEHYGWRAAFMVFGLVGLLLLPPVRLVLKEPRLRSLQVLSPAAGESMLASMRALLAKRAYRNILAAIVLYYFMAYGSLVFVVSLMIRAHGMGVAQAGSLFGAVFATGAVVGGLGGGTLADRLAARDIRWLARLGGWGVIVAIPFYALAFYSPSVAVMTPLLFAGAVIVNAAIPPVFSALHTVCGAGRRALAVAMTYFFANLIGLGLGPVIAGAVSDAFARTYGPAQGLRFSLIMMLGVLLPCGWFLLRAARFMPGDLEE